MVACRCQLYRFQLYLFNQTLTLHVLSNKHWFGATARCSEHVGSKKRQSALHCLHTIIYSAFWAAWYNTWLFIKLTP